MDHMDILLLIVIAILLAILATVLVLWKRLSQPVEKADDKGLLLMQNQLNELNRTLDSKLGESGKAMREQFSESARPTNRS